jgi:hypothetical protein
MGRPVPGRYPGADVAGVGDGEMKRMCGRQAVPTIAAAALFGAMLVAARADVPLAVRPGLWEYRLAGSKAPALPEGLLSALSPEQRMAVSGVLAKAMARSYRACVTAGQIRAGAEGLPKAGPSCRWSVVSSAPTQMVLRNECSGSVAAKGTLRILAPDPATVTATIDATVDPGTGPMPLKETVNGKWLGADCGDVKPGTVAGQ